MPFSRQVECGRVCLVNYGDEYGTLVGIVDIIDANRVLVDGPKQTRRQYNLKRLSLTDLSVSIERGAKKTAFLKAWEEAAVDSKFAASAWGKKLAARAKKASLTDLERHAILVKRVKRAGLVKKALGK